jgi:hypothetical protein
MQPRNRGLDRKARTHLPIMQLHNRYHNSRRNCCSHHFGADVGLRVVVFDGAGPEPAVWGVFVLEAVLLVVRAVEVESEGTGQGDSCWQVALQIVGDVEVGYEAARGRREDICSEPALLVVDVEGEIA